LYFVEKETEKKKNEKKKAIFLQKFIKKRLFLIRLEMTTRFSQLIFRKSCFYKGNLLWIKLLKKQRKNEAIFASFYVFDKENHISFKKIMKISDKFAEKIKENAKNPLFFVNFFLIFLIFIKEKIVVCCFFYEKRH